MEMLSASYDGQSIGLAEENLQSRLRAVTLMGLSNAFGWLLLNTGNKSESSVGYSTLYGDSAGGYAVIKDVSKLLVYRLCRYRNELEGREVIPETVLVKPPSAELRPDQRDDQSLPPYEELDPIWRCTSKGITRSRKSLLLVTIPRSCSESLAWLIWRNTNGANPHRDRE